MYNFWEFPSLTSAGNCRVWLKWLPVSRWGKMLTFDRLMSGNPANGDNALSPCLGLGWSEPVRTRTYNQNLVIYHIKSLLIFWLLCMLELGFISCVRKRNVRFQRAWGCVPKCSKRSSTTENSGGSRESTHHWRLYNRHLKWQEVSKNVSARWC